MAQEQHEFGYGARLVNPEAFIRAVIAHFFSPVPRAVDWENLLHEARVALFVEDLRLGETVPETTSGYWWRVAAAVGRLLYEDYNLGSIFVRRRRPLSLHAAEPDDPATAAIYLEKQRAEPDPATEVEANQWFDHYMALAEGVILDNRDTQQGERDLQLFELWVNGYSPKEIAEHPEVTWLRSRKSVDAALRRIIHRLWDFFGVDSDGHAMTVGEFTSDGSRSSTGASPREIFSRWYGDPANRERHRERCRELMRRARAAAREAREQAEGGEQ